jgi:hypothetical protein
LGFDLEDAAGGGEAHLPVTLGQRVESGLKKITPRRRDR